MSHRMQIVLPDPASQRLRERANQLDKPPATLASEIVQDALARPTSSRKTPPHEPANNGSGGRPAHLEPYGGDRDWRRQMWGEIVALHGRYPKHLDALRDGWWKDEATVEMLSALATWRAELDDSGQTRDEISFQNQLIDYAHYLRSQGGGVTKAWKPDATPPEWE